MSSNRWREISIFRNVVQHFSSHWMMEYFPYTVYALQARTPNAKSLLGDTTESMMISHFHIDIVDVHHILIKISHIATFLMLWIKQEKVSYLNKMIRRRIFSSFNELFTFSSCLLLWITWLKVIQQFSTRALQFFSIFSFELSRN